MIDLMALAKEANETYLDVENSLAGTIRVHHVPDAMLLSIGPVRPEPELPMVRMKTATGFQDRQAKPGDEVYEAYQYDLAAYNDETFKLQVAIGAVSALRDVDWSKYDLTKPPPVAGAQTMYASNWPDHELLRKKAWLDWTILFKRVDQSAILEAMSTMNGDSEPTEEMVEEVKKNSVLSLEQDQKG